jgi:hypothetical protein
MVEELSLIRQKCIEAVPELLKSRTWSVHKDEWRIQTYEIRLVHVLRAVERAHDESPFVIDCRGRFYQLDQGQITKTSHLWNLRLDLLSDQSAATVAFLYALLV